MTIAPERAGEIFREGTDREETANRWGMARKLSGRLETCHASGTEGSLGDSRALTCCLQCSRDVQIGLVAGGAKPGSTRLLFTLDHVTRYVTWKLRPHAGARPDNLQTVSVPQV